MNNEELKNKVWLKKILLVWQKYKLLKYSTLKNNFLSLVSINSKFYLFTAKMS